MDDLSGEQRKAVSALRCFDSAAREHREGAVAALLLSRHPKDWNLISHELGDRYNLNRMKARAVKLLALARNSVSFFC